LAGFYSPPSVSASGRFYEFTDGSTIFVRDSCAGAGSGCVPANAWTTQYGSVGNQAIAAEGRYVVFESTSSTLVPNDTNGVQDIFLVDTCVGAPAGCVSQVARVSVSTDGEQANGASSLGAITPDGRFVTFVSSASNLVADDTNSADDVFVRDTCTGAPAGCSPSTYRVSVASGGSQSTGPSGFTTNSPSISADGRYVAFASGATNLVASDTNGFSDIFVRDTCVGASSCNPSTMRVSLTQSDDQANGNSSGCTISADGHYVAYTSSASNIVPNSIGASSNAFLVKVTWP
jgi:Tol biopolymer transport system component